jgi:hypothetical protein
MARRTAAVDQQDSLEAFPPSSLSAFSSPPSSAGPSQSITAASPSLRYAYLFIFQGSLHLLSLHPPYPIQLVSSASGQRRIIHLVPNCWGAAGFFHSWQLPSVTSPSVHSLFSSCCFRLCLLFCPSPLAPISTHNAAAGQLAAPLSPSPTCSPRKITHFPCPSD